MLVAYQNHKMVCSSCVTAGKHPAVFSQTNKYCNLFQLDTKRETLSLGKVQSVLHYVKAHQRLQLLTIVILTNPIDSPQSQGRFATLVSGYMFQVERELKYTRWLCGDCRNGRRVFRYSGVVPEIHIN